MNRDKITQWNIQDLEFVRGAPIASAPTRVLQLTPVRFNLVNPICLKKMGDIIHNEEGNFCDLDY